MALRVQPVSSDVLTSNFIGFGQAILALSEKLSTVLRSKAAPWNTLPVEILGEILYFVGEPQRTALVCKLWYTISSSEHFYTALLQRYQAYPSLTRYLPDNTFCKTQPVKAASYIFLSIIDIAKKLNVDVRKIKVLCKKTDILSPVFLQQVLELNEAKLAEQHAIKEKVNDLWLFCQSLYLKHIPLPEMDDEKLIQYFESYIDAAEDLYRTTDSLALLGFDMSYLTPKIGRLTALTDLCLRGNKFEKLPLELKQCRSLETLDIGRNPELSVKNVREICKSLPRLRSVLIESTNKDMLVMFETHFPRISICSLIYSYEETP